MSADADRLAEEWRDRRISRREFGLSMSALALARPLLAAQAAPAPIIVKSINHMTLTVSDPKRSLEFYQGLFGMPIQARQGETVILRVGAGPQFIALGAAAAGVKPHINHLCLNVQDFNGDKVLKVLAERGVERSPASGGGGGASGGPMKARVRMRGPDVGGAPDGTPELYFGDPDGIVIQLQDPRYCGGAGTLGEVCLAKPEPAPRKGLIALKDYSHFTIFVSDATRSIGFYQSLFGMPIQAYQGAMPILGVGPGPQFLALAGLPGGANARVGSTSSQAAAAAVRIDHACLSMDGFNPDKVIKTLTEFGIKPRGSATGPVAPLTSYVTMRMPDRGGAKDGTPELYFTDPDGLLIQLQDVSYCGGGGFLGDACRRPTA
jgi:catechol 2,3-dioxygenase-like lactoylglutathione lyase family enzyme